MVRILIVDDEATIRRGLENAVPWKEHGFTVVYAAKNGIDALDFFQNNYADIVISDIMMPRMTGFELQQKIQEKHPYIPFIFVSGYEDFHYAKTALKQGAFSYILKPLDIDELLTEVKRACVQNNLHHTNVPLEKIIDRNFFGLDKHWDFTNFEHMQEECEQNYFCVINVRCHQNDMRSQLFLLSFQQRIQQEIRAFFSSKNVALIESSSRGIIFCTMDKNTDMLKYTIHRFVETLHNQLNDYASTPFGVWTGGIYKGIDKLIDSYVESFENTSFRFINQSEISSTADILSFDVFSELFRVEDDIITLLLKGQVPEAKDLLMKQKDVIRTHKLTGDDTRLFLRHLLFKYLNAIRSTNPTLELPAEIENYGNLSTFNIDEMFQRSCDYLDNIIQHTKPIAMTQSTKTIHQVKDYVANNYSDPYLSLSSIASHVALNASYLSTEFAKHESTTLSTYITNVRIERAKHLLAHSELKITEISTQVGYINATYFSTAFKRATGETPSEFRKN